MSAVSSTYGLSISNDLQNFNSISSRFEELHNITRTNNYSAISFKNDYRKAENFRSAELAILDFDGGESLEKAHEVFQDYTALLATTKSHQKSFKNDKEIEKKDRFRAIIPFSTPIMDGVSFRVIMKYLSKKFNSDSACIDAARFYYPNANQEVHYINGKKTLNTEEVLREAQRACNSSQKVKYPSQKRLIAIDDSDPIIISSDNYSYLSTEWVQILEDGRTQLVHCPNPKHKDNHPSAFISKSFSEDYQIRIHCHKCGNLGNYPKKLTIGENNGKISIKKL